MYRFMQKFRVVSAIAAVLCLTYVLAITGRSYAASGLTISPPLREVVIGPGLIDTTADITLQNNTSEQVSAHLQLVDLKTLGQFGGTSLDKATLPDTYDLANWMSLPGGDTVLIAKGETVKVKVKITNRDDLTPGGHYGAVVITSSAPNSVSSNVNISQQIVSLLFVKKLGGEVFGLDIEPFSVKGPTIPDQVTTHFKSTGNVHVVPRGYIEVTDPSGKVVAKGILNQDSSMILPGTTRQFVTLLQPVASATKPGRYKVTIHYRYDGQNEFKTLSSSFTRGPSTVQYGIILAAGIVLVGVVVYMFRRRKNQ